MARIKEKALEYEISNVSHNYIVSRHNALVESEYSLTLPEQKILLVLASKINPKQDKELKKYHFKVSELAEVLGIEADSYYSRVKRMLRKLQSKQVAIYPTLKNGEIDYTQEPEIFSWIIYQKYEGNGIIALQFHPDLAAYYTELTKNFTPMQLRYLLKLQSIYSLRLYELLRTRLYKGKREDDLETLRFLLGVPEGKLKQYGHFKAKVLAHACEEINEKTDVYFDFEESKVKKKVTGIRFIIKKNPKNPTDILEVGDSEVEEVEPNPELPDTDGSDWVYDELIKIGLLKKDVEAIIKKHSKNRIIANIKYVYNKKDVKRLSSYVKTAISKDYAKSEPVPEYKSESKPEQKKPKTEDKFQTAVDRIIEHYRNSSDLVPDWLIKPKAIEIFEKTLGIDEAEAMKLWSTNKREITETIHELIVARKSRR